jgi:nucleoside-diphosphate-sugar epimerase
MSCKYWVMEHKVSPIYVSDVISAIRRLEKEPIVGFSCHNVATLDYLTVTEIANIVIEVMGLKNRPILMRNVFDIGCDDGYLLRKLSLITNRQDGVDPRLNTSSISHNSEIKKVFSVSSRRLSNARYV